MATKRNVDRQRKLRTLRRTLVLTYFAAALILLPLALIRRRDSRVVVDVTVRGLAFDFAGTGVLIDTRTYPNVLVTQSAGAELLSGSRVTPVTISPEGSLAIERPHLDHLQIAPGTRVFLAHNDSSTLAVSMRGGATAASLTVPRQATIECEYCDVGGVAHERYVNVLAEGGNLKLHSKESRIHLVFETDGTSVIADDDLPVIEPAFLPGSVEGPSSNVVAKGAVTLRDVQGFEIPLQRGETVTLGQPHDFLISRIEVTPVGLHVVMNGWVREIRRGAPNERGENQLPSLLQRLHANQALALYFAAVALFAGTAFNVLRQMQIVREPK